jgi:hypothetical protein
MWANADDCSLIFASFQGLRTMPIECLVASFVCMNSVRAAGLGHRALFAMSAQKRNPCLRQSVRTRPAKHTTSRWRSHGDGMPAATVTSVANNQTLTAEGLEPTRSFLERLASDSPFIPGVTLWGKFFDCFGRCVHFPDIHTTATAMVL